MNNKGKQKSFSDKIYNFAQTDVHIRIHVERASHFRLSVSTLNTTVKNHEETERRYVQCGTFCKQQKLLKHLPLEKLETALTAWFKQERKSNASIDGTHIKEEALHIAAHPGTPNFLASKDGSIDLRRDTILITELLSGESRSVDPDTVKDCKNYRLLHEIEGYDPCHIYNADHTSLFFNLQPSNTLTFKEIFAVVI
jgi:hypothetical protein